MDLPLERTKVEQALLGRGARKFTPDNQWLQVAPVIEGWWAALKEWETNDTFATAFAAGRMTIRGVGGAGAENRFGVKKKGSSASPQFDKQIVLDTRMEGIAKRMDPANYEKKTVLVKKWPRIEKQFGKYPMGLHDLSGCLLNPNRPWATQYKNYIDPGTFYVLMPIPQVADLVFFYLLLDEAKAIKLDKSASGSPLFMAAVTRYKNELTRIKYGAAEDMHTSFVDCSADRSGKFKYGVTGTYKDDNMKTINIPQEEIDERKKRARNYEGILTDRAVVNEVVIAYRQHGSKGSNFPMYGLPDAIDRQTSRFTQLKIVDAQKNPTGQIINEQGALING